MENAASGVIRDFRRKHNLMRFCGKGITAVTVMPLHDSTYGGKNVKIIAIESLIRVMRDQLRNCKNWRAASNYDDLSGYDIIIDTAWNGFIKKVEGEYARAIEKSTKVEKVYSVDIPSGVDEQAKLWA